jgi:hypothetical protein
MWVRVRSALEVLALLASIIGPLIALAVAVHWL